MMRSGHTAAARPAASRLLAAFALAVFFLQGLAIQTHIHGTLPGPAPIAQASTATIPGSRDPLDPANCPLCQEMLHAGAAVSPVPPPVPVLAAWTLAVLIVPSLPALAMAPRHGWQSRAPPRS